jgi:hypothetical protein
MPWYTLDKRLGEAELVWTVVGRKTPSPCQELKPGHPACNLEVTLFPSTQKLSESNEIWHNQYTLKLSTQSALYPHL